MFCSMNNFTADSMTIGHIHLEKTLNDLINGHGYTPVPSITSCPKDSVSLGT